MMKRGLVFLLVLCGVLLALTYSMRPTRQAATAPAAFTKSAPERNTPQTDELPVPAGLTIKTYPVRQQTGQSLQAAINAASPIHQDGMVFHGHTDWHVNWHFWWNERPDGNCSMTSVKTTLTGTILLPQLSSADAAVTKQFDSYLGALRLHELGHFQFGAGAAQEIDKTVSALPEMASCNLLDAEANRVANRILQSYQARERDYDRATGHGKTQGAWLAHQ